MGNAKKRQFQSAASIEAETPITIGASRSQNHASMSIAAGAAAKMMIDEGWNKLQFLSMMSEAWEIMQPESQSAQTSDKSDKPSGCDSGG